MTRLQSGPSAAQPQALLSEGAATLSYSLLAQARAAAPSEEGPRHKARQALRRCATLAACLALGAVPWAQDTLHVSLSSSTSLGSLSVDDSDLLRADGNGSVRPILTQGHWQALLGYVPSDVDALSRRVGYDPESAESLAFSFLTDRAGFRDGDVLALDPAGGLQVLVSEVEILGAFGVPSASLDLDALDLSTPDRIYFSLQNDLPGTLLGDVKDGDVLIYDSGNGSVRLHASEEDLQAAFSNATGSTSSIGDVLGLCLNSGELWFSVQSPSAFDGAVFSDASGGFLVRDETSMGLGGAELSAMHLPGNEELPCLTLDQLSAMPGDTLNFRVHGEPNTIYVALFAGNTGTIDLSQRPGWGAISMDPSDPWLLSTLSMATLPFVTTDNQGQFSGNFQFPSAPLYGSGFSNEEGWSFQMLEIPGLKLSAPFRVLKN